MELDYRSVQETKHCLQHVYMQSRASNWSDIWLMNESFFRTGSFEWTSSPDQTEAVFGSSSTDLHAQVQVKMPDSHSKTPVYLILWWMKWFSYSNRHWTKQTVQLKTDGPLIWACVNRTLESWGEIKLFMLSHCLCQWSPKLASEYVSGVFMNGARSGYFKERSTTITRTIHANDL